MMSNVITMSVGELKTLEIGLANALKVVRRKLKVQEEESLGEGVSTPSTCTKQKRNSKKPIPQEEIERKLARRNS